MTQDPPSSIPQYKDSDNKPILYVDVNIGDKNDRIIVYPNQDVDLII
jgi:hypothetical protein